MCETEEAIKEMVDDLIKQARRQRMVECQANAHLGFLYYQGCLDMAVDILDNIARLERERKNNGSVEVV